MNPLYLVHLLKGCGSSVRWVRRNRKLSAEELWNRCPNGEWLEWAAYYTVRICELRGRGILSPAAERLRLARWSAWSARYRPNTGDVFRSYVPWSVVAPVVEEFSKTIGKVTP